MTMKGDAIKIFMGGTCNDSKWREWIIDQCANYLDVLDFFNPVVDNWTQENMDEEIKQRKECDCCLYVITPAMSGVYSIAEAVDDSNKRPEKTVFCVINYDICIDDDGEFFYRFDKGFTYGQMKSFRTVCELIKSNGGVAFTQIADVVKYLFEAADFVHSITNCEPEVDVELEYDDLDELEELEE